MENTDIFVEQVLMSHQVLKSNRHYKGITSFQYIYKDPVELTMEFNAIMLSLLTRVLCPLHGELIHNYRLKGIN